MPSSAAHFNVLCGWNQTELSNKTREAHVAMPEYVRPPDQRKLSPKIRNSLIDMVWWKTLVMFRRMVGTLIDYDALEKTIWPGESLYKGKVGTFRPYNDDLEWSLRILVINNTQTCGFNYSNNRLPKACECIKQGSFYFLENPPFESELDCLIRLPVMGRWSFTIDSLGRSASLVLKFGNLHDHLGFIHRIWPNYKEDGRFRPVTGSKIFSSIW